LDREAGLALASVSLAISSFVAALKLLQPTSLNVTIYSSNGAKSLTSIPGLYTIGDMVTVSISMLIAGLSAAILLFPPKEFRNQPLSETLLNERRAKWDNLAKTLKDDEARIYQTILDSGGIMHQRDIGVKTRLSKTTVSRTLELLESKGLVEKRRRGMANVILLK
jgi:DNA-binding transcriptional ArsR family regulator